MGMLERTARHAGDYLGRTTAHVDDNGLLARERRCGTRKRQRRLTFARNDVQLDARLVQALDELI